MVLYPEVGTSYYIDAFGRCPTQYDPDNWHGRQVTVVKIEYMPGTEDMYVVHDKDGNEGAVYGDQLSIQSVLRTPTVEDRFRKILGASYGGPSISIDEEKGDFILYEWGDAPVGMETLARGATLKELLNDYEKTRG